MASIRQPQRYSEALTYATDVGVLGVFRVLARLRGLILLPIIARGLGAAAYGAWTQSLVAVTIGGSIVLMQLDVAVVRFVSGTDSRSEQRSIFLPILLVVMAASVLAACFSFLFPAGIAAVILGDAKYQEIAAWLGAWIGLSAIGQLGIQLQRGLHHVKLYGFLSLTEILGQLVIVAILILLKGDLLVAVRGAIAWDGAFALFVVLLAVRSIGVSSPEWGTLRSTLRFSLPLVPSYLARAVLAYSDRLFIAARLGSAAVGVYTAAYGLARIVREIAVPIGTAVLPAVSRAWDRANRAQARWLLANTLWFYVLVAVPAAAGLSILGRDALGMLATESIVRAAGLLIPVMALASVLWGIRSIFAVALQLVKNTRGLAVSHGLASIVYLPVLVIAVERWGLIGGAAASIVGSGLALTLTALLSRRTIEFEIPWVASLKAVLAAAGMAIIVAWSKMPSLFGLLLSVTLGAATYLALLGLLGVIRKREMKFIVSLLRRE